MKRDIPKGLRDIQYERKVTTLKKINEAIDTLEMQGAKVTRKAILQLTGLSSATLSKEHARNLLQQRKVCQYADRKKVVSSSIVSNKDKDLEIYRLQKKIFRLEDNIVTKDTKIKSLKEELKDIENRYELLIGKIHELTKKLEHHI